MSVQQVVESICRMPDGQLEATYNHCWRERHNGTDKAEAANLVMTAIEFVAGLRGTAITGRGGSFEFKRKKENSTDED